MVLMQEEKEEEEEAAVNGVIDLLSALMKPDDVVVDVETGKKDVIDILVPQKGQYDKMLLKDQPSLFGRVMVNIPPSPHLPKHHLNEKLTIYVPFFKFDTPSLDEQAKLVTKDSNRRRRRKL